MRHAARYPCVLRPSATLVLLITPETAMNLKDIDARIGEAWKAHFKGQYQAAIDQFKQILAEAPDHIDANWGLGLSCRKAGDRQSALQAFERVKELVTKELDAQPEEYERFFMLKRMVTQQIEQMADFI